jgi:hypothetical protein
MSRRGRTVDSAAASIGRSRPEGEKRKQRDQNVTRRGAGESNRTF